MQFSETYEESGEAVGRRGPHHAQEKGRMKQFKMVASAFQCPGVYMGEEPYGSGHINDTYKVSYDEAGREVHYILQRVNHNIFTDVPALMENIGHVTRHAICNQRVECAVCKVGEQKTLLRRGRRFDEIRSHA